MMNQSGKMGWVVVHLIAVDSKLDFSLSFQNLAKFSPETDEEGSKLLFIVDCEEWLKKAEMTFGSQVINL